MKPADVLPDSVNSIEKEGVTVRKGTLGAFSENIRLIDSSQEGSSAYAEAQSDLLELIPALLKLNFFDYYKIKSAKVRRIILEKYPSIPLD